MVAAARRYNRVVQVGQQQRSGAHWHDMKRYLESGQLGKIAKVAVVVGGGCQRCRARANGKHQHGQQQTSQAFEHPQAPPSK